MTGIEKTPQEEAMACAVCQNPIEKAVTQIEQEENEHVLTFCSEECFKNYSESPETFTDNQKEEEE